jgi:phosphatidylglycerol:prolipoprotein diacylglycerol transferase
MQRQPVKYGIKMAISYPPLDPVALHLGPLVVRWYSLAYMAGFLGGWAYARDLVKRQTLGRISVQQVDDFIVWIVLGVILGGRIGYVLFYNLPYYLSAPTEALKIWQGGMSFHGGLLGVVIAVIAYAWKNKIPMLRLGDLSAVSATIGLFFGRIANFINDELYGRTTDVPWGVIFPKAGPEPRHPSQIYEAFSEGLLLFILLSFCIRKASIAGRYGTTFGIFLIGYGISRFIIEFFREPDVQIGLYANLFSQGQLLCLPMIFIGAALIWNGHRQPVIPVA